MKRKLVIGILVVLGIAVIAFASILIAVFLIVGWVYLVWMVRKKKINLFDDQMEPELVERRYKMLKIFLLVGGISLPVAIGGVVMHNVQYALTGIEESLFFIIALVGIYAFNIATIGGLVIALKGRQKQVR